MKRNHFNGNIAWLISPLKKIRQEIIHPITDLTGKKCESSNFFNFLSLIFYVSGAIARSNNFDFRHGYCLPASCSAERALNYINQFLSIADFEGSAIRCQNNDPVPYDSLDIVAM